MSRKYKNKVIIEDDYVLKKRNDDLLELFDYLSIRNFDNYPAILEVDDNYIKTNYIESNKYHEITEGIELIRTMASLHSKTEFYKDISNNKHKSIYNKLLENIEYLKEYYNNLIENIESEVYMSPSHYLFARNYSIILGSLNYTESEIKKWYSLVKEKTTERVSVVHNNITRDHFIKGDKNYLISWEKHLVDTPVLDLYKFYKKDGFRLNFKLLYREYNNIFNLSKEEDSLFKILISMPPKIEFLTDELQNSIYIKDSFKYLYESYKIVNNK